mgnify:FL=1
MALCVLLISRGPEMKVHSWHEDGDDKTVNEIVTGKSMLKALRCAF